MHVISNGGGAYHGLMLKLSGFNITNTKSSEFQELGGINIYQKTRAALFSLRTTLESAAKALNLSLSQSVL